jgi:hypothetical protein
LIGLCSFHGSNRPLVTAPRSKNQIGKNGSKTPLPPRPSSSLCPTTQQQQQQQQQELPAAFADASVTVVRPGSGSKAAPSPSPPQSKAAPSPTPPPPRDNNNNNNADLLLQRLCSRSLPNAAAVAAYLDTATAAATTTTGGAKTTKTTPALPSALSGLATVVAAEPAAADVVAAALDLHALSRAAVVNKPNIARMDALGAACVSALDRAGKRRPAAILPADVCLAVAAVLRDCCALAEGFGREGWLLRLACGGAALRDEAEMLHGAALELLAGGGLGWAVPSSVQQRRAALSLAALAGEGAAAALLAALEAESAEQVAAGVADHHGQHQSRCGGGGGAAASSPSRPGGGASNGGGANNNINNASSSGGGAGYVDASRPLRRALRQLGRGKGLAAGVAAAAADPDAADELARLLGVSPSALQAELRAVPVADGNDDLAGLLAGAGGSGGAAVVEAAAAAAAAAPVAPAPQQQHHVRLDLDALHAQLLTRRDAAAFLRAGGGGGGNGQDEPAVDAAAGPAASPVPPAAALAPDPAPKAPQPNSNKPLLRHPAAFARYSTFDPPLGDPSAGVSFAGVRAALHELGLLPTSDNTTSFSPLSSSSDAAVRRHMAMALGWGVSAASSGGAGAAPCFMPPETFDRFFEGVLAANPRARVVDAAGVAVEADLRRVHAAYAAFGHSRSGGGGGGGGSGGGASASASRSPIASRPAWSGVIGRSGGGGGGGITNSINNNECPLLDSAQLSKLLRECGLLPALSSQQAAASRVLPSPLVRLTAADVDIVYTKCCVAAAGTAGGAGPLGVSGLSGGGAGASPSPGGGHHTASSPSPPPALKRTRGLDFDAFCAALVALSERTGAPLQTVLGAVAASSGPVAAASVYYGASVAGSRVMMAAPSSVAGTAAGAGVLRSSRPSPNAGGGGKTVARTGAGSVSGGGGGKVAAATGWKR